MKNIMKNAWEIARKGQKQFGGTVKEYFSEALRLAWKLFKEGAEMGKNLASRVNGILVAPVVVELQGSEKQVAWAKQLRAKAYKAIISEVSQEEWKEGQPKRPLSNMLHHMVSEEKIEAYLSSQPEFAVERTIKSMNGVLERLDRAKEIIENTDAKFWIDNRDNQEPNYMFQAFKKYVAYGIKEF